MTRPWTSAAAQRREAEIGAALDGRSTDEIDGLLWGWIDENRRIHEDQCINLDPAANVMNQRAEQALAAGLSSRPSLGRPYRTPMRSTTKTSVSPPRMTPPAPWLP